MPFIVIAVGLTLTAFASIRWESRRLANALLVLAAGGAWAASALSAMNRLEVKTEAVLIVIMTLLLMLIAVGLLAAAVLNGVLVIRREGLRLSTVLPLALAAAVLAAGFLVAVVFAPDAHTLPLWVLALVWTGILMSFALAAQLVAFTVYAVIYGRLRPPAGVRSVVVLGCGLGPGGSVTPLLASRLDRAHAVYCTELDAGNEPAVVVSGGQGPDEATSEAAAMKSYLAGKGVATEHILAETASRTTLENLELSVALMRSMDVPSEPIMVVTSDFHVLRAAALTRDLGLDAHVTGARSARFYVPTAFLREFVAILSRYRIANLALFLGILAAIVLLQHFN